MRGSESNRNWIIVLHFLCFFFRVSQFITVVFYADAFRTRQSRVSPQGTSAQRRSHSLHCDYKKWDKRGELQRTAPRFAELMFTRAGEGVFPIPRQWPFSLSSDNKQSVK